MYHYYQTVLSTKEQICERKSIQFTQFHLHVHHEGNIPAHDPKVYEGQERFKCNFIYVENDLKQAVDDINGCFRSVINCMKQWTYR